jgi:glucose dehydrogenase
MNHRITSVIWGGLLASPFAVPAMAQNTPNSVPPQVQGKIESLMQDDKQWPMAAKNYANTRFSSLNQITPDNVGQLKLAWTFSV